MICRYRPASFYRLLAQYYFASVQRDIPKSILVSDLSTDSDALTQALNERAGRAVQLTQHVRGQRARAGCHWQKTTQN